jgi:tetratricopeptide (TPR) repeat protein
VSGETVTLTASLGFVTYPQDLRGPQLTLPAVEQARILARKAKSAVITAKDFGRDRIFAFSDIARRGGRILEVLPLERVCVSLGRGVDAQEGQRFLVWSPKYPPSRKTSGQAPGPDAGSGERPSGRYPAMYKGEISLMEVQEEVAFAEVLHLSDPAWPLEPGDRLTLIQEKDSIVTAPGEASPPQRDAYTGLFSYRDFIGQWTRAKHNHPSFCLSLIQVQEPSRSRPGEFESGLDASLRKTAELAQEIFGAKAMGARYSLGTILFFHPDQDAPAIQALMRRFAVQAKEDLDVDLAVGVAGYPCLTFHKTDVLENARKALDHARLLPAPQVAAFDSVTLNLAADKLFNAGDLYGAVEQYKLSLLADEANAIARNSLGICLARLGKLDQAKHHFERVVEANPKDIMALYNLASALQSTGEAGPAREAYARCLKLDPRNRFALIRLGMLHEATDPDKARDYLAQACSLPGGEKLAARHLARLALAAGNTAEAREFLHQALVHNHKDAQSLHLLARLYLDSGEDPEIAETLARQSAALRPDRPEHWRTLAQALTAQGKQAQADEALSQVK